MTLALTKGQVLDLGVVYKLNSSGIHESANIKDLFAGKRIVVFMGPAPFSRLDTEQATDYERLSSQILQKRVDQIIGVYVQDAFVMKKFQEQVHETAGSSNTEFYGDGDGFFVKANNLTHDFTFEGLSTRCGRWAMVLNNGVIEHVIVDDYSEIKDTSAASILSYLNEA
jgi:peroxiredoxin